MSGRTASLRHRVPAPRSPSRDAGRRARPPPSPANLDGGRPWRQSSSPHALPHAVPVRLGRAVSTSSSAHTSARPRSTAARLNAPGSAWLGVGVGPDVRHRGPIQATRDCKMPAGRDRRPNPRSSRRRRDPRLADVAGNERVRTGEPRAFYRSGRTVRQALPLGGRGARSAARPTSPPFYGAESRLVDRPERTFPSGLRPAPQPPGNGSTRTRWPRIWTPSTRPAPQPPGNGSTAWTFMQDGPPGVGATGTARTPGGRRSRNATEGARRPRGRAATARWRGDREAATRRSPASAPAGRGGSGT